MTRLAIMAGVFLVAFALFAVASAFAIDLLPLSQGVRALIGLGVGAVAAPALFGAVLVLFER